MKTRKSQIKALKKQIKLCDEKLSFYDLRESEKRAICEHADLILMIHRNSSNLPPEIPEAEFDKIIDAILKMRAIADTIENDSK